MWYHDLSNKVTVSAFCLFSAILPTVQVNITHLAVHSQAHTSLLPLCIQGSIIQFQQTQFDFTESPPRVAIIREEGSNGDREMAAAFTFAGFEAWDVNMQDIIDQKVTLDAFRGVTFVGGFSYADVCGSAKGKP